LPIFVFVNENHSGVREGEQRKEDWERRKGKGKGLEEGE